MKYFKILLRSEKGSTRIVYPEKYHEEIGPNVADHAYIEGKDGNFYLIVAIPDEAATGIVRKDVEELKAAEVKKFSETHEERKLIVTNEAAVRLIDIKVRLGKELTPQEKKALDPDNAEPGFGKQKIFADRVKEIEKRK